MGYAGHVGVASKSPANQARGEKVPQPATAGEIHPDFRLRSSVPELRRDKSSGFICGL
jgi:hypothetical protein